MPKVALINPGKDQRYATQEPLHLGFLASYLEKPCCFQSKNTHCPGTAGCNPTARVSGCYY